jgi:hypothetical protein
MHLQFFRCPADFTDLGEQSLKEFCSCWSETLGYLVFEDRLSLSSKWYPAEVGNEWFPVVPLVGYHQAFAGTISRLHRYLVLLAGLAHTPFVLVCECFQERGLHNPSQFAQMRDVVCKLVVLNVSPVFALVVTDDCVIVVPGQLGPVARLSVLHIDRASLFDDFCRYPQLGLTVDTSVTSMVVFCITVSGCDIISEEPRRIGGGVGDQGLVGGEFQFEMLVQERCQLFFAFLGFGSWPDETQEEIIRIPDVT